jgi:hypothetical protein
MASVKLPTHVQYRNATYYGILDRYQRNGHGLLVLDNSQILLGIPLTTQPSGRKIRSTESTFTSQMSSGLMAACSTDALTDTTYCG